MELHDEIAEYIGEDTEDSDAHARWKDELSAYVDAQGLLDALRLRSESEAPWPARDNPMLCYITERAHEIAATKGPDAAFDWLALNAWFEGAIAERSRFARAIENDEL